jgi:nucleotide-binding universal stress UspA family protein
MTPSKEKQEMGGYQTTNIVVPVDFSAQSFDAVDTALQFAERPENVHVVYVEPELNIGEPELEWQTIDIEARSQSATQALRHRLSDEKYRGISFDIEVGDPGYRIVEFAKRTNADLVVMPSMGRTGIAHLLLGSVAERVVRHSHCPVLVLRS